MRIAFDEVAWEDYEFWQATDRKQLKRINRLLDDICRDPESSDGIGKPERLKHALAGARSRRIDSEHRVVYLVEGDLGIVLSLRYHY
ncbi:Txe/YoeB family addiction module toxin [Sporichthya polymorpha]|uniref:Txe/YoeB family addiction module toxin n=1 Tax=Sporichthya polymorpha TaxID=35751 RepID=UPI00038114C3|nr:Txe/YoeB family addiction module toxin [Sporichthya polymorpha]